MGQAKPSRTGNKDSGQLECPVRRNEAHKGALIPLSQRHTDHSHEQSVEEEHPQCPHRQ